MKFSRATKADELIDSFNHSYEGTIYSALIASAIEINDKFTNENDYFYDSNDEKLITAADLIYQCGTPKLTNILSSMEGKLGISYANGIEKLLDELLRISKKIPIDLLEDVPVNFSQQNFGLLGLMGSILQAKGAGTALKAARGTNLYKTIMTKSSHGQVQDAIKKTGSELVKKEELAREAVDTAKKDLVKSEAKFLKANITLKDSKEALNKSIARADRIKETKLATESTIKPEPSKIIPQTPQSTKITANSINSTANKQAKESIANSTKAQSESNNLTKDIKAETKARKKEIREKYKLDQAKREFNEANTNVMNSNKGLKAASDSLDKSRETFRNQTKETNEYLSSMKERINIEQAKKTRMQKIGDRIKDQLNPGGFINDWFVEPIEEGSTWKGAAILGGLEHVLSGSGKKTASKAAEEVVSSTKGQIVDNSRALSKLR